MRERSRPDAEALCEYGHGDVLREDPEDAEDGEEAAEEGGVPLEALAQEEVHARAAPLDQEHLQHEEHGQHQDVLSEPEATASGVIKKRKFTRVSL